MPTLEWIGKDKVVNHHLDVPYRVLEHRYTYMGNGSTGTEMPDGNKIIRGDNLEALKALLPQYEGRIKCIYIDPPYNTGNEGWVYNDNVNDPKIKKWLGEVVGKEGEDLCRHDKWLCMMYPRLKLLQRLLSDDGAIFISLDDNEQPHLRLLCNEIFNKKNFYTQIIIQSNVRGHTYKQIAKTHEYILVYTKSDTSEFNEISKSDENDDLNLVDNIGKFNIRELRNRNPKFGRFNRPNLFYEFYVNPKLTDKNGFCPISLKRTDEYFIEVLPKNSSNDDSCWRWGTKLAAENIVADTMLSNLVAKKVRTGGYNIYEKYRKETVKAKTIWFDTDIITEKGTVELGTLGLSNSFEFPKPVALIERTLQLATDNDSIILDSFAGSGTTAHAVLKLNKQDSGNRKFILVEMMDYAESVTAERVRRVIDGYADVEGTGGAFSFYDLGEPLLLANKYINEAVPVGKIREYVWFMETQQPLPQHDGNEPYLLGCHNRTAYFFYYEKDRLTTLDRAFLRGIKTKADAYLIYADINTFSDSELARHRLIFKKIPRDIAKL